MYPPFCLLCRLCYKESDWICRNFRHVRVDADFWIWARPGLITLDLDSEQQQLELDEAEPGVIRLFNVLSSIPCPMPFFTRPISFYLIVNFANVVVFCLNEIDFNILLVKPYEEIMGVAQISSQGLNWVLCNHHNDRSDQTGTKKGPHKEKFRSKKRKKKLYLLCSLVERHPSEGGGKGLCVHFTTSS